MTQIEKTKTKSVKRLTNSFKYAFEGILSTFKNEQNFTVHFFVALLVIVAGIVFEITTTEWLFVVLAIGLVIAAELINTAFESITDLVTDKLHPLAKICKDTAAGAVLILALTSAVIGLIIFVPYFIDLFKI